MISNELIKRMVVNVELGREVNKIKVFSNKGVFYCFNPMNIVYEIITVRRMNNLENKFADSLEHPEAVSVVTTASFYTQ